MEDLLMQTYLKMQQLPILLPRQENFSKLLIQDIHHKIHHCGVSQTLAQLRQRYWMAQGRTAVKMILKRCLICLRFQEGS